MKNFKEFLQEDVTISENKSINVDKTRNVLNKRIGELRGGIKAFNKSLSSDEQALLSALPSGVKGYSDISKAIMDIENALYNINRDLMNGQSWDKTKLEESEDEDF